MSRRDALSKALREVPIPVPEDSEARGLRVVETVYAERQRPRRRAFHPYRSKSSTAPSQREGGRPLRRTALALALTALIAVLMLSPAGASVRSWVDDVFTAATPKPEPTLGEIPGGGRLLVQSAAGPWVVHQDGSRRLLGDYEEATWSPRGLYVAVAKGRTLSAVEPDPTLVVYRTRPGLRSAVGALRHPHRLPRRPGPAGDRG
jgi:hypothetical protein